MPRWRSAVTPIFGVGGVQGLDGEEHARRKGLLLSLMTAEQVGELADRSEEEWRGAAHKWRGGDVQLYAAAQEVLTRAVCRWAGTPLEEPEVAARTRDLTSLFDAAGSVRRHFEARRARRRSERWAEEWIVKLRVNRLSAGESVAARIALYVEPNGRRLPLRVAAVELLNVLRPTVAVSVYVVFLAHALHAHPEMREKLEAAPPGEIECFVEEVRRLYPFFPAVPARVREDFEWQGFRLRAGTRTLFDLYGTNHDPRIWERPDTFLPDRFREARDILFGFVPQGGGDPASGHRCAGEWITVSLMQRALRFLVDEIDYSVPEQDLHIDFGRLPALPASRFVLSEARPRR